ncbi:MAG: ATP-binding protein [Caldimonas sp.]|uniref:sensor histidine kinase n=1 Tax=Caldimonas sp. TaxID=2838790 RepID=UPI00391BD88E
MLKTLRAQLIFASAAILVLMSGLLLWAAQTALRSTLQDQFAQQLQVARPLLVAALSPLMAARDYAAVHEVVRQSVSHQGLAFLEVLDADARVVAGSPRPPDTPELGASEAPLEIEGQVYGHVRFGVHTEGLQTGLLQVTRDSVLIGALVLALGVVLMVGLTTWLTQHLRSLAQASHRMARGESVDRIPAGAGPRELRQLAQAFNQMTGALQQRMQALGDSERRQRSLVDDLEGLNAELEARVARRTAELQAARDAAEQANRAKSEFLSRMSHELRTPLNAILGFAQVLRARANELPPLAAEPLRHIEAAGWHLLQMINEVLDLARIESGRMSVSLESVDLAELLQQALQAIEPLAQRKGVELHTAATLPAPCWVRADRTRARQVLDNLLSNAVKYNRPQGRVTARVDAGTEGWVVVSIIDTGRGMDAQQLAHLFEPFTRFVPPGEGIEGTGIGLLITRRLLEAMGGGSMCSPSLAWDRASASSCRRPRPRRHRPPPRTTNWPTPPRRPR